MVLGDPEFSWVGGVVGWSGLWWSIGLVVWWLEENYVVHVWVGVVVGVKFLSIGKSDFKLVRGEFVRIIRLCGPG